MNKLKQFRESANLTQLALSQISGVNIDTIQNMEINRVSIKNARAHIVVSLANALGVKPEELWED